MEEKKHCDGCKYSDEEMKIIEKAEKDVRKAMGGAFGLPKDIPYLYSFVSSALELGWLDKYKEHSNYEKIEKDLKEFSLEAAKAGKTVCTRDGRKARIICFDRKDIKPIVALVTVVNDTSVTEKALYYFEDGHHLSKNYDDINDLMMLPEKKEGWVNVYKRENEYICENECNVSTGIAVYKSEGEAKRNIDKNKIYVNTIKITWEE